jgi:hypothetical protein
MAAAPDFNTLHNNIAGAEVEFTTAQTAFTAAHTRHELALANLNLHQKAFDDAVATFRASITPPAGSYWAAAPKPAA